MDNRTQQVAISLFAGAGGSSLGYENAGFNVALAVDNAPEGFSKKLLDVYEWNHPKTILLREDITTLNPAKLKTQYNLEDLTLLDGSPPCSPFSTANSAQEWKENKSATLFDYYIEFVRIIQPKLFIAENVPGLATGKTKGYFNQILANLKNAGYNVRCQLIDGAYLGSPHHRRRLIFMGVRKDFNTLPPTIKPQTKAIPISESWKNLENTPEELKEATDHIFSRKMGLNLIKLKQGQAINDTLPNYGFSHYRLRYDLPAPTITNASSVVHPVEKRLITIAELKRLIGLPDNYKLSGSYSERFECCIRCLPPIMMQRIAETLLTAIS